MLLYSVSSAGAAYSLKGRTATLQTNKPLKLPRSTHASQGGDN